MFSGFNNDLLSFYADIRFNNDKAFMDDVAAALREFGMSYLEPENKDGQEDQGQVFVYDEPGVVSFTAPLDYIVATALHKRDELEKVAKQNKAEAKFDKLSTKDLVLLVLDSIKVDALESKKEKVQNGSTEKEQEA